MIHTKAGIAVTFAIILLAGTSPAHANPKEECATKLEQARKVYENGAFTVTMRGRVGKILAKAEAHAEAGKFKACMKASQRVIDSR